MAIYFVQCTGTRYIKIGYSENPRARLSSLQTGSASELQLLNIIDGNRDKERELHEQFRHLRVKGEWYYPSEEVYALTSNDYEGSAFDLWSVATPPLPVSISVDWFLGVASPDCPFQIGWIKSNGIEVKIPVHATFLSVYSKSGIMELSIDPWEGIIANDDYTDFRNRGGILPATARALDQIAQEHGFTKRMFTEIALDDCRQGSQCLLAWRAARGLSVKGAMAAMYYQLQCIK
jgi:hypothetical protein